MSEKCWWKSMLLGTGIACGIASVGYGGYKGGEYLYGKAKELLQRHMPTYHINHWRTSSAEIAPTTTDGVADQPAQAPNVAVYTPV